VWVDYTCRRANELSGVRRPSFLMLTEGNFEGINLFILSPHNIKLMLILNVHKIENITDITMSSISRTLENGT
jgi:hypothetical protein